MTILICGLGSIGRRHLRNLQALGRDDIVLLRTGKSTLPEDELEGFPVERELDQALVRWRPEAVIVSNPTALHLEVAIPSAEAGCHLLIEKPVSHTMEGIEDLQKALNRGGGQVLVGFQFRFHPGLRAIKRLLGEGAIGRVISAHAHWGEYLPDWHPWEDYHISYAARKDLGGGVVLTLCHPFDYLSWLLGEVETVSGVIAELGGLDLEVEDTAELLMKYRKGNLASVHLDYNQRPASHCLEIIGTEGTIRWDGLNGETRCWSSEMGAWESIPTQEDFERNDMFLEEMRHFLEVIKGTAKPISSLEDGVEALRIALTVKRSAEEDGRWIQVSD
ncbi:MAG: Gfo/Idh/MocA family oxidoreductase [Anaerolineaceae bacterium]|nr:MAG: Gfo/Idh/MocA family oxidoreductase [Anaerolineaceae bacterium]